MNGSEMIAKERQRQIEKEGWTPEHDAGHQHGELAKAAACYAVHGTDAVVTEPCFESTDAFPWALDYDKRGKQTDVELLTKAGALVAAEIDRLLYLRG